MSEKPLRQSMSKTAEFIDALREFFGEKEIKDAIRVGMNG